MENKYILSEYMYSKEYEDAHKNAIEYMLFLQWVKDLIDVTKALNNTTKDKWYQEVFYIHLVGLFEVISGDTSISANLDDSYNCHVKECVEEMYSLLTENEYIYLVYSRHSAAHPFQNGYDLYDTCGKKKKPNQWLIKGKKRIKSTEDIVNSLDQVTCEFNNDNDLFDSYILKKLTPHILRLQEGIYERYLKAAEAVNLASNPKMYETMTNLMSS